MGSQLRRDKLTGQLGTGQHRAMQQQYRRRVGLAGNVELYRTARSF
ncbi:hypothetical protein [Crystallibacter degradans]|nr:hypothetical protein [Arthrobacter sp. SF27]